jgi:hypothetical protein
VDVHRHWKVQLRGPGLLVLAVVLILSPQLLSLIGYEFRLGNWVGYVMGAVALLGGIAMLVDGLKAYALRIDAEGVTWTQGKRTTQFRWADISRVAIERKSNDGKNAKPTMLTVWTSDTVTYDVKPDTKLDGLHGYQVADTGDVAEPAAQIEGALRQYAGDRFVPAGS